MNLLCMVCAMLVICCIKRLPPDCDCVGKEMVKNTVRLPQVLQPQEFSDTVAFCSIHSSVVRGILHQPYLRLSLTSENSTPSQKQSRTNVCEACAHTLAQSHGAVSPTCCMTFVSRAVYDCMAFSHSCEPTLKTNGDLAQHPTDRNCRKGLRMKCTCNPWDSIAV